MTPSPAATLSSLLKRLRDNGTTLIVSSHILSELREYATHYAIIDKGALQDAGELAATVTWRCRLSTAAALEPLQAVLNGRPDIRIDEQDNDTIFFHMSSGEDAAGILRELINAELPVCEFSRVEGDIERIYRNRHLQTAMNAELSRLLWINLRWQRLLFVPTIAGLLGLPRPTQPPTNRTTSKGTSCPSSISAPASGDASASSNRCPKMSATAPSTGKSCCPSHRGS